jgi:hypothetical protein
MELSQQHTYLTRLRAILSPEEMTIDPMFDYDSSKADVNNIHNLQEVSGLYECERNGTNRLMIGGIIGGIGVAAVAFVALVAVAIWFVRRRRA